MLVPALLLLAVSVWCWGSKEAVGKFGQPRRYAPIDHVVSIGIEAGLLHSLLLLGSVLLMTEEDDYWMLWWLDYAAILASLVASLLQRCTLIEPIRRVLLLVFILSSSPSSSLFLSCVACWCAVVYYHLRHGFGSFPRPLWRPSSTSSTPPLSILFLSIGTRGDVQPFIALAKQLLSRNHSVALCALEPYRALVEQAGVRFLPAGEEDLEEADFWRQCTHVSQVMHIPHFAHYFLSISTNLLHAAQATQPDVIVCTSTAQSMAMSVAETFTGARRPPVVMCAKFAPDHPTRAYPAPGYSLGWPAALNVMSWYHHWVLIALAANKVGMGPAEDAFRSRVGLPKLTGGKRLGEMADCPTLLIFSSAVIAPAPDWGSSLVVTGWWTAASDEKTRVLLPLTARPRRLCIAFGSMTPSAEALGLIALVLRAAASAGGDWDDIVLVGNKLDHHASSTSKVRVVREADYRELFASAACVVHHGGAGTTASCLEAGTPALVIPVLLWTDQPLWADRVRDLSLGFHVQQRLAFDATDKEKQRVFDQVRRALHNIVGGSEGVDEARLRQVAECVRHEDGGVCTAADAIEYCAVVVKD